jgi:hypothetical protein
MLSRSLTTLPSFLTKMRALVLKRVSSISNIVNPLPLAH